RPLLYLLMTATAPLHSSLFFSFILVPRPPRPTVFPYTTLFRSWASSGLAGLPLCFSNRKIACCAILLLSPFLSYPGFSTGKIPQKLARIGLEWIEYKSVFLSLYFYIPSGFRTSQE